MSDITQALQLAFDKLGDLAKTYGPPAINTAAEVVRVDAMQSLAVTAAIGAAGLCLGACSALLLRKAARLLVEADKRAQKERAEAHAAGRVYYGNGGDNSGIAFGVGIPLGVFATLAVLAAIVRAVNVWTWVALANPKLVLAAHVLHALPGFDQ